MGGWGGGGVGARRDKANRGVRVEVGVAVGGGGGPGTYSAVAVGRGGHARATVLQQPPPPHTHSRPRALPPTLIVPASAPTTAWCRAVLPRRSLDSRKACAPPRCRAASISTCRERPQGWGSCAACVCCLRAPCKQPRLAGRPAAAPAGLGWSRAEGSACCSACLRVAQRVHRVGPTFLQPGGSPAGVC